jgi:hypothetical protein
MRVMKRCLGTRRPTVALSRVGQYVAVYALAMVLVSSASAMADTQSTSDLTAAQQQAVEQVQQRAAGIPRAQTLQQATQRQAELQPALDAVIAQGFSRDKSAIAHDRLDRPWRGGRFATARYDSLEQFRCANPVAGCSYLARPNQVASGAFGRLLG